MRYKISNILWGILLMGLGVGIAGNVLQFWDINFFFHGWWTLFIIIPSFIGIVRHGIGSSSSIWFAIGVMLLLSSQGVLEGDMVRKLFVPIILIIIGIHLVLKNLFVGLRQVKLNRNHGSVGEYASTFSGRYIQVPVGPYYGSNLDSIFGGLEVDLRQVTIDEDVVINATSIFGGIEIMVPSNVKVKYSSTSIFGGVSNQYKNPSEGPIVYINGTCMFGGVNIK